MISMRCKPQILIVSSSAPPLGAGGVSSAHYNLYALLKKRGLPVSMATFGDPVSNECEDGIFRFGGSSFLIRILHFFLYIYLKFRGSRKLAYQMADIAASLPGVLKLNRLIKYVSPDIIVFPDHGAPGLFLAKGKNSKLFLVAHHNPARFIGNPLIGDFCPLDANLAVSLEERVLNRVSGVICPSEYMLNSMKTTYGKELPAVVIPNLVDVDEINSIGESRIHEMLNVPIENSIVYIPSAGSRLKGSQFVFEIIRRLSNAYNGLLGFYLSGNIPVDLAEELRHVPSNARLLTPGQLPYCDHLSLVKGCSFGISPTLIENFSMAFLEAGYCGVPMVVFDVGGTREMIADGENGYLIPYLDIEELIARAIQLLDKQLCLNISKATRSYMEKRFDQERIMHNFLNFIGVKNNLEDID